MSDEDAADATPEEPQIPPLSFTLTVLGGKNLERLLPAPGSAASAASGASGDAKAGPSVAAEIVFSDAPGVTGAPAALGGSECTFEDATASFDKQRDPALMNFLCRNPARVVLREPQRAAAEGEEASPGAALGSFVVDWDPLINGATEVEGWYHVDSVPEGCPEGVYPELRVRLAVTEALQTAEEAELCTIMTVAVDGAYKIPTRVQIKPPAAEGEEAAEPVPSPADLFRFCFRLAAPTSAEEDFKFESTAGCVTQAVDPPPQPVAPAEGEAAEATPEGAAAPPPAVPLAEEQMQTIQWSFRERAYVDCNAAERLRGLLAAGEGLQMNLWRNNVVEGEVRRRLPGPLPFARVLAPFPSAGVPPAAAARGMRATHLPLPACAPALSDAEQRARLEQRDHAAGGRQREHVRCAGQRRDGRAAEPGIDERQRGGRARQRAPARGRGGRARDCPRDGRLGKGQEGQGKEGQGQGGSGARRARRGRQPVRERRHVRGREPQCFRLSFFVCSVTANTQGSSSPS